METNFVAALEAYRVTVRNVKRAHFAGNGYTFAIPNVRIAKGGRRYVKLIATETRNHETTDRGVHSFVEKETGMIYKAASYKAPAKHPRGSIYNEAGRTAIEETGSVKYLR